MTKTDLRNAEKAGVKTDSLQEYLDKAEKSHAFKPGKASRTSLGPLCAVCDGSPVDEVHKPQNSVQKATCLGEGENIDTDKVRSRIGELLDATREKHLTHEYAHGYLRGSCYVLLAEIDRLRGAK